MDQPAGGVGQPPLWVCPKCGARLVSRNLWHSCGHFTLEDLFARAEPSVLDLARTYVSMLHSLDDELMKWLQESHDTVGLQRT